MFDSRIFAAEYDDAIAQGIPPFSFGICDRRVLVPMDRLPEFVQRDSGETFPECRVGEVIEAGWIPALTGPDGELGFPLYVPWRVGLFLRLERAGWSPAELAAAAEEEEGFIQRQLSGQEMPYEDDDVRMLRAGLADNIGIVEHDLSYYASPRSSVWAYLQPPSTSEAELRDRLADLQAYGAWLADVACDALPADDRARLARDAYVLRAQHEHIRMFVLEKQRDFLASGYSFFVLMQHANRNIARTPRWTWDGVLWDATLRELDIVSGPDTTLPIRLPGLVIDGDRVLPTERMTPSQYRAAWDRYDLDGWIAAAEARAGRRVCERCLAALPPDAKPSRRFCGEACRNAEKAESYRRRHPDRVKRSQQGWRTG